MIIIPCCDFHLVPLPSHACISWKLRWSSEAFQDVKYNVGDDRCFYRPPTILFLDILILSWMERLPPLAFNWTFYTPSNRSERDWIWSILYFCLSDNNRRGGQIMAQNIHQLRCAGGGWLVLDEKYRFFSATAGFNSAANSFPPCHTFFIYELSMQYPIQNVVW